MGVDKGTAETKFVVEFPVGIDAPIVSNDKIYVGETDIFGWKNRAGVLILDKDLNFVKEIGTYPNIKDSSVYNGYMFCNCMSWDRNGMSGFSVIDLKTDTLALTARIPDMVVNEHETCWGYNGKVYLGTEFKGNLQYPFSVTVVNTEPLEVTERTEVYSEVFPYGERTSVLLNENQIWSCYRFKEYICVYNLDTDERIATIDLRNFIPETANEPFEQILDEHGFPSEWNCFNLLHQKVVDGVYYSIITNYGILDEGEPELNAIFGIDTKTFELCFLERIDADLANFSDYRFSESDKDIIFLRKFNIIYKYSVSKHDFVDEIVVFDKETS